jgi:hypothetical protein
MSGGSYDYAYCHAENFAASLEGDQQSIYEGASKYRTPHREAFASLLRLVAKAMHDIEWVDSCDYGEGDENEAIMAALMFAVNHDLYHLTRAPQTTREGGGHGEG